MHEGTLVVSDRGQITLPAVVRETIRLTGGDVVILEDRVNELALGPGTVVEGQIRQELAGQIADGYPLAPPQWSEEVAARETSTA
jgi:AbrB family looped-hinge helix DNA binding protein